MIKLNDVLLKRNNKFIIKDINWKFENGEKWVLLGKNGIGKSTLINILSTTLFPTAGNVEILGKTLGKTDVFELRKLIGVLGADLGSRINNSELVQNVVMTQKYAMTGVWGDSRDVFKKEDLEKANELLNFFGVEKIKDRYWGLLSQGERKRVMLARALMNDPKILLFDEPTAGLDLAARETVINILNKLSVYDREFQKERVVVLVNHNIEEIPPSFNKIAIMGETEENAGTIIFKGDIDRTLTSENLSKAYGVNLDVTKTANLRYFASASVIIEQKSE